MSLGLQAQQNQEVLQILGLLQPNKSINKGRSFKAANLHVMCLQI
jgi:hypothetical protein